LFSLFERNDFFTHDLFHRGLKEADLDRLHKLHLDGAPKRRSKAKAAKKKKKAVVSTPTRVTTTMVITASKKTLKKSPAVEKMDSASVNSKPSGVNEASEHTKGSTTPLNFTAEVVAQREDSVRVATPVAVKRPTSYSPGAFSPLPLSVLMDAALGYHRAGSLPFDSEVESAAAVGTSFIKQVSSAPFVSPSGYIPIEWSSLPSATLSELGYPQVGSLPFDSEVESAAAVGTSFTKEVSSAPFASSTGPIPVEWSSLPLATLADTALGMDHYEKSFTLDALVSPCKSTKKESAGPTLDYTTLFAQDSVASPAAGILLANPTHDQGVPLKMSVANSVSAFATSPVDAAVLPVSGDVDVSGRLACMESVRDPSTPPVAAAGYHYCPATPVKCSGEQLSAFSPISIPARKVGPSPPGTSFESSLVSMPSSALSLRLGELANLSDDELLVGQVEAV
jgi:hypothetical protein